MTTHFYVVEKILNLKSILQDSVKILTPRAINGAENMKIIVMLSHHFFIEFIDEGKINSK
ncbi:CLUMA_CG018810, isoform A [Clunio marinus]|uniref:CLUMA_CG018810, isoform A n=1 Tax=Clunio marinus TaxID=568069 RepID=A0A1J1J2V3_9DIPT|nr:CLUMA_CG018810, isoform A [Clunio marinus]